MSVTHRPGGPVGAESVYVYGEDPTATCTMVVGLALRRHRTFSWADCAISDGGTVSRTGGPLSRGRSRATGDGVSGPDLAVPQWSGSALEGLLIPESRMDSLHLMSYLALPGLLQELAAMSISPSGDASVVLANIDALERGLRASVFARPELHRKAHSARISLFVTSRSQPTGGEAAAFDLVLRLAVPRGGKWSEAEVFVEKAYDSIRAAGPIPLRTTWQVFGLDPTLLPPT